VRAAQCNQSSLRLLPAPKPGRRKDGDGGPAGLRATDKDGPKPFEMAPPGLAWRIEKPDNVLREGVSAAQARLLSVLGNHAWQGPPLAGNAGRSPRPCHAVMLYLQIA